MALSASDRDRIVQQSEAWLDSQFGGLDLSSYPALNPLPPEDVHDDRFAREYENPAQALRRFVRNPDNEALVRVGREIGNDEFLDEVRDRKADSIARQFKLSTPDYLSSEQNYENTVAVLAANLLHRDDLDTGDAVAELIDRGHWTVENLQEAWRTLKREGAAQVPLGTPRELTPSERLHVTRMAQSGDVIAAIAKFLEYSIGISLAVPQTNSLALLEARFRLDVFSL